MAADSEGVSFTRWVLQRVSYVEKYNYVPGGYNLYDENRRYLCSVMNVRKGNDKWLALTELLDDHFVRNGDNRITTTGWKRKGVLALNGIENITHWKIAPTTVHAYQVKDGVHHPVLACSRVLWTENADDVIEELGQVMEWSVDEEAKERRPDCQ